MTCTIRPRLAGDLLLALIFSAYLLRGRGPFAPIDMADVHRDLASIKRVVVGPVALGGHDTSDEVLALFARKLGPRFRRIEVGSEIVLP